jgi:hypothetical protein
MMDVLIHLFLNLRQMNVHRHLNQEAALMSGKAQLASIGQKAKWAAEPVWTFWRRKKSVAPAGN